MSVSVSVFSKKALLVINPVAGRKMIQRNICDVVRCLMDQGYLVTTAVTSRRGEARELSYSFGRDFDLLVCAGGDGTLNECISGMAEGEVRVPVGYLPCGSTNDFALSHGLPLDPHVAAATVAAGSLVVGNARVLGEIGDVLILANEADRRFYFICKSAVDFIG